MTAARFVGKGLALTFTLLALTAEAAVAPQAYLAPMERENLRSRLETLYNEVDLLLKNQRSDRSDFKRQDQELTMFKVLERMPLTSKDTDPKIGQDLQQTARSHALIVKKISVTGKKKLKNPVPKEVLTDLNPPFRLSDDQLAEAVSFEAVVDGKESDVKAWIQSWKQEQTRFAEPAGEPTKEASKPNLWKVVGKTYRFRDIQFPHLRARDPMTVLPVKVKKDLSLFASKEPHLWSLVTRTRDLIPRTPSAYERRARFMLASQRMEFFVRKTEGPVKR